MNPATRAVGVVGGRRVVVGLGALYVALGVGLALCERIVERHGGEIGVDSTPGEGATFSVTLPRTEDAAS